jgi:glucose-1-phosphate adenylyltransferase
MGIYLFNREVLIQALVEDIDDTDSQHDFGRDILPRIVADSSKKVYGSRFHGYWRDVGTIEAYFEANMDLLEDVPELNLYDPDSEVRTRIMANPPVKVGRRAQISRSLLSVGAIVNGEVDHSVLSPGVYVEEGAIVRDSIIFDGVHIKSGAIVEKAVLDKEVTIGTDCHVGFGDDWTVNQERPDIVNSGVAIVGKRAELLPGVKLGRNCVIGPGVVAAGIDGDYIPSGQTIRAEQHTTSFSV